MEEPGQEAGKGQASSAMDRLRMLLNALGESGSEEECARLAAEGMASSVSCTLSGVGLRRGAGENWSLLLRKTGAPLPAEENEGLLPLLPELFLRSAGRALWLIAPPAESLSPSSIPGSLQALGVRSLGVLPMASESSPLGILFAGKEYSTEFSTSEQSILKTLARMVAIDVENYRLRESLRRYAPESAQPADSGDSNSQRDPESEEPYRTLYMNAPVMLQSIDRQGRVVSVNERWLQALGYERSEVLGRQAVEFATEESRRLSVEVYLPRFMETGLERGIELQLVKKNGEVMDVLLTAIRIENVEPFHGVGMIQDVTELKRAERALRESEERFRKIFEHSNDAVFLIDPEQDEIVDCNSKACRLLEYSRQELLALPVSAVYPEEMPVLQAFSRSVLDQGSGWTDELTCRTKSGQRLPAEISASVMEIGGKRCLIALVRDITDRKRAQETLQQYSIDLQRLVEERTAELRQSEERQRVLLEVNNAVVSNLTRDALFGALAQALSPVIPYDLAALTLCEPGNDSLRVFALHGPLVPKQFPTLGAEIDRRGSHLGWVLDHQRPLIRRDLEREHQFPPEEKLLAEGIRSFVVVPLPGRQRAIGTLNVASKTPNQFSEKDAELLLEVAKQIALAVENMLAYEEIGELKARLEQENLYLQEEIKIQHKFEEIVGRSAAIRRVLKAIETVAPTDATVLILGETGTGKELVARAVHHLSPRRDRALVTVNCAALPAGLIESELFGHEKGAFTGALSRKLGRFELADGGTILLDEIGDLPLDLQAKLLRVLQEGQFERVGGSQTIRVRVRVIAATNRDLEKALQVGTFREDLYYRLNVFPIQVPPLRDRKEDIPHLVRHLAMKYCAKFGKKIETIPQAKMKLLLACPWPGNIRELENVIERAVIVSRGPELDLGEWPPGAATIPRSLRTSTLAELEREHILRVLKATGWHVSGEKGAARILGIKRTTLQGKMKKLGIQRKA